jgi:hypothetical protein
MSTKGLKRSLLTALTLLTSMAIHRNSSAMCTYVGLRANGTSPVTLGYHWQGVQPLTSIVFLNGGSDLSTLEYSQVGPIDLQAIADRSGSNCKTDAHINIPGVGLSREFRFGTSCSTVADCPAWSTPQCKQGACISAPTAGQYTFGDVWANDLGDEILSAQNLGWQGALDFLVYLGVTSSSLKSVPSYPQVGTLDFVVSGPLNGVDGGGHGGSCTFDPVNGTCLVIASIPVYVEDVAVIASLPVIFR